MGQGASGQELEGEHVVQSKTTAQEVQEFAEPEINETTRSHGIAERLNDGEVAGLILPFLLPMHWRAAGSTCKTDNLAVQPSYLKVCRKAKSSRLYDLVQAGEVAASALRLWSLSGIDAGELSMPKLVNATYTWAHYARRSGRFRPVRRSQHLRVLLAEAAADGAAPGQGIQATMRSELVVVQAAVELGRALGRSIDEVDKLPMVPTDAPGKLEGRLGVTCQRSRSETEATALMWATRFGVRWVEMLLKQGADPTLVTPHGWTALLYGAVFQSRGISNDGSTDSGDQYGGYRRRARGVIGPLVDAGAVLAPTLPLDKFLDVFAPSPVQAPLVGPVEVARTEATAGTGWADELLGQLPPAPPTAPTA